MVVLMHHTEMVNLSDRLIDYGFTPEYSRLINCLADNGIMSVEDIWYVTGEYWNVQKGEVI